MNLLVVAPEQVATDQRNEVTSEKPPKLRGEGGGVLSLAEVPFSLGARAIAARVRRSHLADQARGTARRRSRAPRERARSRG